LEVKILEGDAAGNRTLSYQTHNAKVSILGVSMWEQVP